MYTVEKTGNSTYQVKITISPEEWETYVEQAYEETKGKFSVQGFRKGKAPRKVLEKTYGENIFFDDAIDIGFSKEYAEVLAKETQIQPIDQPRLKLESFDEKGLVILAEVDCVPEVKLGKYKGLEIEKHDHPVEEGRVEKELNQARERRARFVIVERAAQMGDIATIDFVGSVDGKEFEGGAAEGHRLELGSKTFIDTFEEQVAGMQVGEKKDVKVKFPEEYGVKELAGKDAVFAVTLTKVEEKQLPELNDEFASSVSEFETLAEYKEDIRKNLEASNQEHLKRENENNLLQTVVDASETEIPQILVDRQLDIFVRDFETRLSYQGMKLEDYLAWSGVTMEQLREQRLDQAKDTVKTRLVLEKLIDAEGLYVTQEELDNKVKELADKYKKSLSDYKKSLGERQLQYFENELLMEKVFKFLVENNTFVEGEHSHHHHAH